MFKSVNLWTLFMLSHPDPARKEMIVRSLNGLPKSFVGCTEAKATIFELSGSGAMGFGAPSS